MRHNVDVLLPGIVGGTGGASRLMLELASRLTTRGMSVKIVVPEFDTTRVFVEECRAQGVAAECTPWLLPREARLARLADVARFLHRYRAPVVHYHLSDNMPSRLGLHAMDMIRPPRAFVTLHSPSGEPSPGTRIAHRWAAAAPRHFHKVICVSERARRLQIAYGLPKELVQRIPNGVDLARIAGGDAARARRVLGVDAHVPIVTVIARVAQQKRPLDAVASFAAVASQFPDAQLVFIGSGPLENDVRDAAAQAGLGRRVHLLGQRTDVADWLAAATVWLLPTETEGFSVAVIEALAAGCAIVSTDCPGNDEVLENGSNAMVVRVGDVEAMSAALCHLLVDGALRARLGDAARHTAEAYSLERMVDAHIACYAACRPSFGNTS